MGVVKTKAGWEGNERIDLGDGLIMRITTGKDTGRGRTVSLAICHRIFDGNGYKAEIHDKNDWWKTIFTSRNIATERHIRAMHDDAMAKLDELIAEAKAHYGRG